MQAFAIETFQNLTGRLVVLDVLHSLWIGLMVAAIVALALQVTPPRSHRRCYRDLLLALSIVTAGPVVVTISHFMLSNSRGQSTTEAHVVTFESGLGNDSCASTTNAAPPAAHVRAISHNSDRYSSLLPIVCSRCADLIFRCQGYVVAFWLAGVVALGIVLTLGALNVRRICREARPAPQPICERAAVLARRARMKTTPRVLVHPRVGEPCLCGLFRPSILLPEALFNCGSVDQLDAILAHELAHAQRLDTVVNLAQRLVEVVLFFSPAVHWLSRSLRRHREFCADELAVRLTGDPLALAAALESAALFQNAYPAKLTLGAFGGQATSLLPRIQELLGMTPSRPRLHVWPFATLPLAGLVAFIAAAAGRAQAELPAGAPREAESPRSKPASAGSAPTPVGPVRPHAQPESDNQISYEVRFVDLRGQPWHELLGAQPNCVVEGAGVSAWVVTAKDLDTFVIHTEHTGQTKLLRAPKITSFVNSPATIITGEQNLDALMDRKLPPAPSALMPSVPPRSQPTRPARIKDAVGSIVELKGSLLPDGIQLSADLHDSAPAMINKTGKSAIVERRFRVACDVPTGSALVVCFGPNGQHGEASEAGANGNKSADQPRAAASLDVSERLVLITPRAIVTEAEERTIPVIRGSFENNTR